MKTLREYIDLVSEQSVEEGNVVSFRNNWSDQESPNAIRKTLDYDSAHKLMTTDEYLAARDKLGRHYFDPDAEPGAVYVRYAGEEELEEVATPEAIKQINDLYNDK